MYFNKIFFSDFYFIFNINIYKNAKKYINLKNRSYKLSNTFLMMFDLENNQVALVTI